MRDRENILDFYSPYNFCRKVEPFVHGKIVNDVLSTCELVTFILGNYSIDFYYKVLSWDSEYFGIKTIRIFFVRTLVDQNDKLVEGITAFEQHCSETYDCEYVFIEIPSEDITLIQAFGESSFRTIETRLHYYHDNIQAYNFTPRFEVRRATFADIANLRRVAREMRNDYDRFHADSIFNVNVADDFMSEYVEASIKGFCDLVIVPDIKGSPSDSFLTGNLCKEDWPTINVNISKMIFSAVSSGTNKGWYLKLISEMNYLFQSAGVDVSFLTTQSTNRAVYKVWNKLGFELGAVTHILSK